MKKTQSHQDKNWIGIDVSKTDLEIHSLSSAIKIPAVVSNSLQGFRQIEDAISKCLSGSELAEPVTAGSPLMI